MAVCTLPSGRDMILRATRSAATERELGNTRAGQYKSWAIHESVFHDRWMNTVMPILHAPERRIVIRLMVELRRDTSSHYLSGAGAEESYELTSVMGSIYLADLAGRHATASMLSRTTGIPRAAVLRRLKRLSKAGIVECVEGRYRVVRAVVNSPESVCLLKRSVARIKEAARKLSRLDEIGAGGLPATGRQQASR